jgi:hypothetical protein
MADFHLVRSVRTLSSEVYVVWDGERRVGQLDAHFAGSIIYGNLMIETDLSADDKERLYQQVDEDVISSYLPSFERDDFILTVFRGEEVESFSYPPIEDEELEE